jgi:hypothetical protein
MSARHFDQRVLKDLLLVVQKVMGHVIESVSKYAAAVSSGRGVPVPEDDSMGKLPEWRCECDKKCWWHDKSVFVHRKVVVDAVKKEMQGNANAVIW